MWWRSGVVATLVFLAAACTQPAPDNGIASAGGATTGSTTTSQGGQWDPIKWVQCLREHGITVDDPDPAEDSGKPHIDERHTREEVDAAADKCRAYNPNWGVQVPPDPADVERQRQFAQCMREHGFEFADPGPPGGPSGVEEPGGPTPSGPQFDQAARECAERVPGVVVTEDGTKKAK